MGYYITIEEADFTIPADKLDEAFEAVKALDADDSLKSGGSWSRNADGSTNESRHFAWMAEDWTTSCKSIADVFEALGFEVDQHEEGVSLIGYDSKTGDERHFVEAVAPFVRHDSWINWTGEEHEHYRWVVRDGVMTEEAGSIAYDSELETLRGHLARDGGALDAIARLLASTTDAACAVTLRAVAAHVEATGRKCWTIKR